MRRLELFYSFLTLLIDIILLLAIFLFAYYLRYSFSVTSLPYGTKIDMTHYLGLLVLFIPLWMAIFFFSGVYRIETTRRLFAEISKIFWAVSFSVIITTTALYILGDFDFSRLMLIYTWILAITLLTLARVLLYLVRRILLQKGMGVRRVLILGRNKASDLLVEFFKKNKGYGYRLVKILDVNHEPKLKELDLIISRNHISDIIQVKEFASQEKNIKLIKMAHERQIVFKEVPNLYELRKGIYETGTLGDVPMLEFKSTPLEGWGRIAKRFIDVVVSATLLIILLPFFLIIAIIIRLDSPGPIFFRQERVGKNKNFEIFKLRSMYEDAEERKKELWGKNERKGGPLFKIKNDPRITRVGKIIRMMRSDEWPQFINV